MRVYITRNIPTPGLNLLREKNIELDIWESDEPIPHDVLVEKIKNNYDGLYCMLTDTIDGKVLDAAGNYYNLFLKHLFVFIADYTKELFCRSIYLPIYLQSHLCH